MEHAMLPQTRDSLTHILQQFSNFRVSQKERGLPDQPMIVGISGCQGSGKTTLCHTLSYLLKQEPYRLNVVNFSLDDVYLNHQDQRKLSQTYPKNKLYQQRGQAGSHDLKIAVQTLDALVQNQSQVLIPVYDKSLFDGQGDRVPQEHWKRALAPIDIVLFEGWMLGFKPLPETLLESTLRDKKETCPVFDSLSLGDLQTMNTALKQYETEIYPYFNSFIHLSPLNIQQVYQWRLEQERHMKSTRGVSGLSDEGVKQFVDTYMPAYELYLPQLDHNSIFGNKEAALHLRIVLDSERKVVQSNLLLDKPKFTESNLLNTKQWSWGSRKILFAGCALLIGYVGYKRHRVLDSFFRLYKKNQ
ncbi:P-loop containing nucleoside triphosphate hydrolase protein [Sporodiniella umbellata]|nr:P-loop containing nucleoside triphosphate hydrolase protein [Sporodiniella umbellata]